MKKPLFIVIGIVVILLVLGFWVYLMFFNSEQTGMDMFADFGFDIAPQQDNPIMPDDPFEPDEIFVDVSGEPLRQLTLRPVAGFIAVTASSSSFVRYAENGTGHIYEINLETGEENRISGTTIPRVTEAHFSDNGTYVALVSESGYTRETFFGEIIVSGTSGSIAGRSLPLNLENIHVGEDTITFTITSTNGTDVYKLAAGETTPTITNSLDLRDLIITRKDDETLAHPKPSKHLEGSFYEVAGNTLRAVTPSRFGLTGLTSGDYLVSTQSNGELLLGEARSRSFNEVTELAITPLPEKCDLSGDTLWCASPSSEVTPDYIEDWYKGTLNSEDSIWETNLFNGVSTLRVDLFATTNRPIDVTGLKLITDGLYFINKIDGTLWQYDLTAI